MQESIRRILKHQYRSEKGSLELSDSRLELILQEGEKFSGSVEVTCKQAEDFRGYVYSSHYRMHCEERILRGDTAVIHYQFDSTGMQIGDCVKGEFCMVTNLGQYFLPFQVQIEVKGMQSSIGPIKNLFHFINLAKLNWKEAVDIFYSDTFVYLFEGVDKDYLPAYRGLSRYPQNEQNMEEFLLLTNKKKEVKYSLLEEEKQYESLINGQTDKIVIEKDGWGYTCLQVEVIGDFIEVSKKVFKEDDFNENLCELFYNIHTNKLHAGKNRGKIIIKSKAEELIFEVLINQKKASSKMHEYVRERNILTWELMDCYLRFSIHKTDSKVWLKQSETIVERMVKLHTNSIIARLYQTHILLVKEKLNEAKWILKHVENMLENHILSPQDYAYYLYLTSMYENSEEVTKEVIDKLSALFEKHREDYRIYWFLLDLDKNRRRETEKTYEQLQELFFMGENSPILYLEAYRLMEKEPRLLRKIGDFEVQILRFAVKYQVLSEDVIKQICYLSLKSKEYYREILPVLEYAYEKFEQDETLQTICSLLIQNACMDKKYFVYFETAVLKNMRITRLYEYYMYTLDLSRKRELPKAVLLFFSYECALDYERKAYLYASVLRQKEEILGAFAGYRYKMLDFVKEQIHKQHVNDDLLFLYENFLEEVVFDEKLAADFVKMVFKFKVFIDHEDIQNVVVLHEQLKNERIYPVFDKKVYVSLYTKECVILLEDSEHNRYVTSRNIKVEPVLLYKKLLYLIENFAIEHTGFFLHRCEDRRTYAMIDRENVHVFAKLLRDDNVHNKYKCNIGSRLLKYYYENDYMDELADMLKNINYSNVRYSDRAEVARDMVLLQQYDLAYQFVMTYGFELISPKTLVRICDYKIRNLDGEDDYALVQMCHYVFDKGKYSEDMLSYLLRHFEGTSRQMKELWMAACNMQLNTEELERRILKQLLLCGGFLPGKEEIFNSYAAHMKNVDDLMRAYVEKSCYDYFVKEYVVSEELFAQILNLIQQKEPLSDVCKLAFLKYFAQLRKSQVQISLEEKRVIKEFVNELITNKVFFSFFLAFKEWVPMLIVCAERTYVEYHAEPGCRVNIHYLIAKEGKEEAEYQKEVMREMYDGFYTKSFCLFFSEHLQYYITKEKDGVESLVESGEVEKADVTEVEKETRFSILNDILMSRELRDSMTTRQLMEEYCEKVFVADEIFKLM